MTAQLTLALGAAEAATEPNPPVRSGQTTSVPGAIANGSVAASTALAVNYVDPITEKQLRLGPAAATCRTPREYRRSALWWAYEAERGYDSTPRSRMYAFNMWRAAQLAEEFGPGTWPELKVEHERMGCAARELGAALVELCR